LGGFSLQKEREAKGETKETEEMAQFEWDKRKLQGEIHTEKSNWRKRPAPRKDKKEKIKLRDLRKKNKLR